MSFTPSVAVDTVKESSIPTSNGKILYVGGSGLGNYTRIQDAIDTDREPDDDVYSVTGHIPVISFP